ncbi:MAG: hypothetical protein AAB903_03175 [Patescibacteria group bacterium]
MDQRGRVSWDSVRDTMADKGYSPEDLMAFLSLEEQTQEVLSKLTPREEELLRKRFGDGLWRRRSQFAVSRRRLRQIEANALRKLKLPRPSKKK